MSVSDQLSKYLEAQIAFHKTLMAQGGGDYIAGVLSALESTQRELSALRENESFGWLDNAQARAVTK